jgi:hypothetical protein
MRIKDPRDHNEEATLILNWKRASFSSLKPVGSSLGKSGIFSELPLITPPSEFQREVAVGIGRRRLPNETHTLGLDRDWRLTNR